MNIAVYHNLPSGGGKRALYEMARRLGERHTLDVYTLSTADHDFCDLRAHTGAHKVFPFVPLPLVRSPIGRLNQGIRAVDLLRLRRTHYHIAQLIDAGGYDCVFVNPCRYGQSPSLLQFVRTPAVYYCHEPPRLIHEPPVPRPYSEFSKMQRVGNLFDPLPKLYQRTLGRLDYINVRAASRVLVNSHYSRETLYRTYGTFANVVYLGVDTKLFRPRGSSSEGFLLSVGALNPHKGFDFLIHSLALLGISSRPPLVIVSNFQDVRERRFLEELAAEKSVSVTFKTLVSDEELVRLYNQAQLTLYAPVMEPFGFVPLESMACGTPVVAVREAGVRETVLDTVTGVLLERVPRMMAAAIQHLLDHPALSTEYGANALRAIRAHWTWDKTVATLEEFLQTEVNA